MARKCRNKPINAPHANMVTEDPYVALSTKINLVGWIRWIDTGAFCYASYDRAMFKTCTPADDKKVLLGDFHTTKVGGIGDVELQFTLGKKLILKHTMHALEIRKNMISIFLLNKAVFTQIVGVDLYTVSKNDSFVAKGYAADNMFKLNVVLNKTPPSIYMLCGFNILYCRLCHDNKHVISNLSSLGLI